MRFQHCIIFTLLSYAFGAPDPLFLAVTKQVELEPLLTVPSEDQSGYQVQKFAASYQSADMKSITVYYTDATKKIILGFLYKMNYNFSGSSAGSEYVQLFGAVSSFTDSRTYDTIQKVYASQDPATKQVDSVFDFFSDRQNQLDFKVIRTALLGLVITLPQTFKRRGRWIRKPLLASTLNGIRRVVAIVLNSLGRLQMTKTMTATMLRGRLITRTRSKTACLSPQLFQLALLA